MFGFIKKTINLGRSLIVTPVSLVEDVVTGNIELENTQESLDEVGEDFTSLLGLDEED